MTEITSAVNNLTILLIIIGGSLFTLCIAGGAILYMTAAGDPHKQQIARTAMLSSIIGVVILAMAPLAPRILSRFVIEPSGGQALTGGGQTGCDQTLQASLVTQRGVGTALRANSMIRQIQAQRANECSSDVWDPEIGDGAALNQCVGPAITTSNTSNEINGTLVPTSLVNSGNAGGEDSLTRDADGNIMVEFADAPNRPTDTARCWMYLSNADIWVSHTANAS